MQNDMKVLWKQLTEPGFAFYFSISKIFLTSAVRALTAEFTAAHTFPAANILSHSERDDSWIFT